MDVWERDNEGVLSVEEVKNTFMMFFFPFPFLSQMKSVVKRIMKTLNTTLWLKIKEKKKRNIEMTGLSEFHVSDVQASPFINLPLNLFN